MATAASVPASRPAATAFLSQLEGELSAMREAGTYKRERVITSPQAARITVSTAQGSVLNMCANK